MSARFFRALARRASLRYRSRGQYARHFAFGKLTRDPVFRHVLERGLVGGERLLDLGCGQGVLEALLAESADSGNQWPRDWAPAPVPTRMSGIDLDARDVEHARAAAGPRSHFACDDIRTAPFTPADTIVLLDVLHYLEPADQDDVLDRARAALAPGGVLLLRVADASRDLRFRLTLAADRFALRLRGRRPGPFHCRPLEAWQRRLAASGLCVEAQPMSAGTPFANVLLVARP